VIDISLVPPDLKDLLELRDNKPAQGEQSWAYQSSRLASLGFVWLWPLARWLVRADL
jgi:hypothetical protein